MTSFQKPSATLFQPKTKKRYSFPILTNGRNGTRCPGLIRVGVDHQRGSQGIAGPGGEAATADGQSLAAGGRAARRADFEY